MGVRMGVENLNAMMDLGIRVDIEAFHVSLDEERKHVFKQNSIQYHIVKPKASVEVFLSGKVIFTGLMTLGDMGASKDIVLEDLAKAGINPPGSPAIKVTNIVASGDLGMNLDLNELLLKLGCGKTEYEPEQFPGLICKLDDPQVTVLLFNSGKMICTGTSDADEEIEEFVRGRIERKGCKSYIPCLTRGLGFSIVPGVYDSVTKAIDKISKEKF